MAPCLCQIKQETTWQSKSLYFMSCTLHKSICCFPGGCCWLCNQCRRYKRCLNVGPQACETAAEHLCPCNDPSRRFRCSSTCAPCCSTASLRLGTPASPAAADGPWRWGPPAAGSRPVGGRTARPSAGCLPSPAALRCDAAAAPDNPPAERHHVSQYKSLKMCKNYSHAFMCHVVTVFNNNNWLSKKHNIFLTSSSFTRASGLASLIRQSNTGCTRTTIGTLFT